MSEQLAGTGAEETSAAATSTAATAAATYTVVADVNVRSGPSTSYAIVGRVSGGSRVTIYCQTPGQTITGPLGTSNLWDRIGSGRYITDTFVRTGSDGYVAPRC
ncbi:SH3 domain-containing protein [Streptomyces sporangiiformans]|uniref:SH3 domain-containing protein n=1 Tax=Streptomyces sporangiiformans TaxID=2315329 RepID=A0A505DD84_9ACTN|nr:SH3 domain-containing protein [Streptomyces sporangiiformans]TPQ20797.1 SH3 domain-containing protein [Streptomyces sporangiiformans]